MALFIEYLPYFHALLGICLAALTLAFLMRIILTWYPKINIKSGILLIISWPTEPFLVFTRKIVKPIGGVDVTPVIWVGLISLFRELLVGQQGVLSQILTKSQHLI